jgi:hypothetical protein
VKRVPNDEVPAAELNSVGVAKDVARGIEVFAHLRRRLADLEQ